MTADLESKSYRELMRILENRAKEFRWSGMEGRDPVLIVRGLHRGDRRERFTGPDAKALLRQAIRYLAPRPR